MSAAWVNLVCLTDDFSRASLQIAQYLPVTAVVEFLPTDAGMATTPNRPSTRWEIAIGRSLAIGVHPVAAWLTRSTSVRLQCAIVYFAFGYVLTLITLLGVGF